MSTRVRNPICRFAARWALGLLAISGLGACDNDTTTAPPIKETAGPDSTRSPADPTPSSAPDAFVDAANLPGRIHVVQPQDTLMHLADHYYGERGQWRRIWQANKRRLHDPNELPVGMKLIIP